jgi:tetratricopeptide (TPR) repeat protein
VNADIAHDLGLIYKKAGEAEDALSAFEIAAALEHVPALIEAAKILEKQKEFERALQYSDRALALEQGRFMLNHRLLADIQKRLQRLDKRLAKSKAQPAGKPD